MVTQFEIIYFSDLKLSDSGLYTCQARSISGQAVWSAALRVADPKVEPNFEIRSMPYLTQFPSSPIKPALVNATDTSITIFWDKPHRIGGSKLKGYQVRKIHKQRCINLVQLKLIQSAPKFFFTSFLINLFPPEAGLLYFEKSFTLDNH